LDGLEIHPPPLNAGLADQSHEYLEELRSDLLLEAAATLGTSY
jgi:hypothetical protein